MTHPFSLLGKSIIVTGASSGIGRQTCVLIAQMGGRVIATARDATRLEETRVMLAGDGHSAVCADLTRVEDRASIVDAAGSVDGLVHSAGVTKHVPLQFVTEKHIRDIMSINYEAPILMTQSFVKARRIAAGGSIVFLSSTVGLAGLKAMTIYAGSKSALIASTRVMALELASRRIRVNCVAPAMVQTPMAAQTETAVSAEAMLAHESLYPLGLGRPEDVASAVVFLLSDASRWMTGSTLVIDGGYACQ